MEDTSYLEEGLHLLHGDEIVEVSPGTEKIYHTPDGKIVRVNSGPWIKLHTSFRNRLLKELGPSELKVFLCICLHIDEGNDAFPRVSTICEETGYKEREVRDSIAALQTIGLIGVTPRPGHSNVYSVYHLAAYGSGSPNGDPTPALQRTPAPQRRIPLHSSAPIRRTKEEEPPYSAEPAASGDGEAYSVEIDTLDQYPHFKAPNFNKALKRATRFDCPACGMKASIGIMDRVTPCCNGVITWKNNDLLAKKVKAENTDAEAKRRRELKKQHLTPGASYLLVQAIATDPQHRCSYIKGEADRIMAFEQQYGAELICNTTNIVVQEGKIGRGLISHTLNKLSYEARNTTQAEPKQPEAPTQIIDTEKYKLPGW